MKLAASLAALLLVVASPAAWATGGINLFWGDCSETGQSLRTFACDTNAGYLTLYVSLVPPQDFPQLHAVSSIVMVKVAAGTLPDWWLTNSGQCRQGAINVSYHPSDNVTSCPDIWLGAPNLYLLELQQQVYGPNTLVLNSAGAVPAGSEVSVVANGTELYVCRFVIMRSKSAGTGSCPGCGTEACLVLNECTVHQREGFPDLKITHPAASNWVSWQAESALPCPESTPARNRTWGAVKELYR